MTSLFQDGSDGAVCGSEEVVGGSGAVSFTSAVALIGTATAIAVGIN